MNARRALLLAGSLWEIVRFFLHVSLLAGLMGGAAGAGPSVLPWMLLAGSGSLVIAVGGVMLSLFPARYAPTIVLLRIGKVLEVFSFVLFLAAGGLSIGVTRLLVLGPVAVPQVAVLLVLSALDLLFLLVLLAWRREDPLPPAGGSAPPPFAETEARDFH
jgi:hypothetical protein